MAPASWHFLFLLHSPSLSLLHTLRAPHDLMFSFSRVAAAFAVALTISSSVCAIGTITRTGRYLYSSDGSRFFIKGVAYQEQGKYYFCQDFIRNINCFHQVPLLWTPMRPSLSRALSSTLLPTERHVSVTCLISRNSESILSVYIA